MDTEKISIKEASAILNVCKKTLWQYTVDHRHKKILKKYKISHKNVRFCKKSIYDFQEKCLCSL